MKYFLFVLIVLNVGVNVCAQNDSSHAIHIGGDFIIAPITQFMDDQKNEHNFSAGISGFINFDNVIALRAGGNYHLKKYSVFDDKVNLPDVSTTFNYVDVSFSLVGYLIKKREQQSYLSLGLLFGKPIYKEGEKKNYSIDYMNNANFSYKIGMGYKQSISKRNKIFIGFEPTVIWFAQPIEYGDYGSGGIYPVILKTTSGNHSRVSFSIAFLITYNLAKM